MQQKRALVFLAIVLTALLPLLFQIARPFFTSFILAAVLAVVMFPAREWLAARLHRPGLASLLVTVATVAAAGGVVAIAGFTISGELTDAYEALSRRSLDEGGWPALVTQTADRIVDALATRLPLNKELIRSELIDHMKTASGYLLNNVGTAAGGLTTMLLTALLVSLFLYFLLHYGRGWLTRLAVLTPLDPVTTAGIFRTINDSIFANVTGVFAAAVGQGVFLSLGFFFVGMRSPMLWGALGGLSSIIPVVGAPLVWVPVVVAFLLMGAWWKAVVLGLWGALVVGSIDNILRPFVVGAREEQSPVLIALAAIGGTYAFGPLGILLGPLVVSLAAALLKEIHSLASQPIAMTSNAAAKADGKDFATELHHGDSTGRAAR